MAENGCQTSCLFFLLVFVSALRFECLEAGLVPGIYVFGDSLIDVGNNNYLKLSILKANFPHNGIDFPNKKPTGRFCNGKNAADFLAEKVGLATSPPYLSLISKLNPNKNKTAFVTGVSFASGGAGIMNETNQIFVQSLSLTHQVDYFSDVSNELAQSLGASAAQLHLSKSIFIFVIGSNDIFGYSGSSDLQKKNNPQQYVDFMILTLEAQLKRLYNHGARKFVMIGIPALGCIPAERKKSKSENCNSEMNQWGLLYNQGLKSMLQKLKMELSNNIHYSFSDSYAAISDIIQTPSSFGFVEIKAACCGLGKLNADTPCLPIATYCSNRLDHLFWDLYHPTEAAHRILADIIFDGPSKYTFPLTMKQLISV